MRTCTIEGCGRPHKGRGFCERHIQKLRKYGDPLAGKQRGEYGDLEAFLERAIAYEGNECTIWPFSIGKNGYGKFAEGDRETTTNRYVCIRAHGAPPSPRHDAAHSCRNRRCLTPRHLSWKTRKENMDDQLRDGTRARGEKQGGSKLTAADVIAIRQVGKIATYTQLAESFGVSISQIANVVNRKHWRHV